MSTGFLPAYLHEPSHSKLEFQSDMGGQTQQRKNHNGESKDSNYYKSGFACSLGSSVSSLN